MNRLYIVLAVAFSVSCDPVCIECSNPDPNVMSSAYAYCEGGVYTDDQGVSPSHDGVTLTEPIMQDIINDSNGWCDWGTIAGEQD